VVLYQDLPVFADVYKLTLRIFAVTQDFPREYKFTWGSVSTRKADRPRHIPRSHYTPTVTAPQRWEQV